MAWSASLSSFPAAISASICMSHFSSRKCCNQWATFQASFTGSFCRAFSISATVLMTETYFVSSRRASWLMALPLDRVIRNATGRFRADRVDRIGPAVRTEGFIPDVLVGAIEIGLRRCICGDLLLFQCPALLRAINLFE